MAIKANDIIRLNKEIIEELKIELTKQGHSLTGKTFNTMRSVVFIEGNTVVMEAHGSKVIAILNYGVTADRIPYSPGAGSGQTTSKYIQGLKAYAKKRWGLSDKKALGAAFAIAHKQKEEGMPTKASYVYSETGQRLGAIDIVFKENTGTFDKRITDTLDLMLTQVFNQQKSEVI